MLEIETKIKNSLLPHLVFKVNDETFEELERLGYKSHRFHSYVSLVFVIDFDALKSGKTVHVIFTKVPVYYKRN